MVRRVIGLLLALVMLAVGGFIALAGMGHVGAGTSTSQTWTIGGSLIAGLGVALGITAVQRRH